MEQIDIMGIVKIYQCSFWNTLHPAFHHRPQLVTESICSLIVKLTHHFGCYCLSSMGNNRLNMEITFDIKEEIINTSFASDWTGCDCGCGEGGPGIPGTLGTTVTGLTS